MSKVTIGGKTYNVPSGKSISVINNVLFVDGKKYSDNKESTEEIVIKIEGDITGNLSVEGGDVEIKGTIGGDVKCSGSVNCDNVKGSVEARGSVNCDDVAGDVKARGSVNCDDVKGSVEAGGSVIHS